MSGFLGWAASGGRHDSSSASLSAALGGNIFGIPLNPDAEIVEIKLPELRSDVVNQIGKKEMVIIIFPEGCAATKPVLEDLRTLLNRAQKQV